MKADELRKDKISNLAACINNTWSYTDRYGAIEKLYNELMQYDHADYKSLECQIEKLKSKIKRGIK